MQENRGKFWQKHVLFSFPQILVQGFIPRKPATSVWVKTKKKNKFLFL